MWNLPAHCRLLRYRIYLELDLGHLHCSAEAGVLIGVCSCLLRYFFSWRIVYWLDLVSRELRHATRRLLFVSVHLQHRPSHHIPFCFPGIAEVMTSAESFLLVGNLSMVANCVAVKF